MYKTQCNHEGYKKREETGKEYTTPEGYKVRPIYIKCGRCGRTIGAKSELISVVPQGPFIP